MEEKFMELLNDQEFVEKLMATDEPGDVQSLLKENGVELTLEEIDSVRKMWNANMQPEEDELSEDSLEDVAGGAFVLIPGFPRRPPLNPAQEFLRKFYKNRW